MAKPLKTALDALSNHRVIAAPRRGSLWLTGLSYLAGSRGGVTPPNQRPEMFKERPRHRTVRAAIATFRRVRGTCKGGLGKMRLFAVMTALLLTAGTALAAPTGAQCANQGYNLIIGAAGDDVITGTRGAACIFGLDGNDLSCSRPPQSRRKGLTPSGRVANRRGIIRDLRHLRLSAPTPLSEERGYWATGANRHHALSGPPLDADRAPCPHFIRHQHFRPSHHHRRNAAWHRSTKATCACQTRRMRSL